MSDDTLDVDELDEAEVEEASEDEEAQAKPKERQPGLFSRLGQRIRVPIAERAQRVSWGFLNWRLALTGAIVLLVLWLLLGNLSPVRVVLWLWVVDLPKAVAFILDVGLGALLMWLWVRYRSRKESAREGEAGQ